MSILATPAGIDHDYNFLHSIETRVQRSERVLIEDLGIVSTDELKRARAGEDEEEWKRRHSEPEARGEKQIERVLRAHNIKVTKAPKGMRRNKENTTTWNKKNRDVHFQVEWVRAPPVGRTLYRALGNKPIGDVYDVLCEEERWMNMPEGEKKLEKKRKAAETKSRNAKRTRLDSETMPLTTVPLLQNPQTTSWDISITSNAVDEDMEELAPTRKERNYNLYLLRPSTPACFPRVLKHIDPNKPLIELLQNRTVLEFPTIHVLDHKPEDLPNTYMTEKAYLAATGNPETDTETDSSDDDSEDSDDTSSSDDSISSEKNNAEDGEIVEL
jgi:hypothetical protein